MDDFIISLDFWGIHSTISEVILKSQQYNFLNNLS